MAEAMIEKPLKRKRGRPPKQPPLEQVPLNVDGTVSNQTIGEIAKRNADEQREKGVSFFTTQYDPTDVSSVLRETNYWRTRGLQSRVNSNRELEERINEYFEICAERGVKCTVEGLCLAIGYSRAIVGKWKQGLECDRERQSIIQAVYDTFAAFDAAMAVNNKLNPVLYFFRAKNYYEMRDQQDIVVTPNNPLGEIASEEDLRRRIETDVVIDDD